MFQLLRVSLHLLYVKQKGQMFTRMYTAAGFM